MSELIKKLRAGRERVVTVEGFQFRYRRPTDYEIVQMRGEYVNNADVAVRFVVGWDGVRECDIVKGTSDAPAEFSTELFREWCHDHPEFWSPLREAIMSAYLEHTAAREAAEKN